MSKLAERIEWVRENRGLSGRAWSLKAGLSPSFIGTFLTRARENPSASMDQEALRKLAAAADLSVAFLQGETDDPSPARKWGEGKFGDGHAWGGPSVAESRESYSARATAAPATDTTVDRDAEPAPSTGLVPLERAVVKAFAPLAATVDAEVQDDARRVARKIHTMAREGSDLSAMAIDVINAVRQLRLEGRAVDSEAVLVQIAQPRWSKVAVPDQAAIEEPEPALPPAALPARMRRQLLDERREAIEGAKVPAAARRRKPGKR